MSVTISSPRPASIHDPRRRSMRRLAAVVCGIVTLTYLWMFLAVRAAESNEPENTFGAYLFLAITYAIGTALLLWLDNRVLWALGAVVQVAVVALFLVFGLAVFDYDAVADLPLELWVATTLAAQLLLVGLLAWLAATPAGRRAV